MAKSKVKPKGQVEVKKRGRPKLDVPRTMAWNFRCPIFLKRIIDNDLPKSARTQWLIMAIHEKIERDGGVVPTDVVELGVEVEQQSLVS